MRFNLPANRDFACSSAGVFAFCVRGLWDVGFVSCGVGTHRCPVYVRSAFYFSSTAQYGRLGRVHVHLGDSYSGGKVHQHNLNFRDLAIATSL